MTMSWFAFGLTLFGLSWGCVGIYRGYALRKGYVDKPNVRSSHSTVTPRGGGITFASLWLILLGLSGYLGWVPTKLVSVFIPSILVMLVGFKDDMTSVSAKMRLLVQTLAALTSLWFISMPEGPLFFGFDLPTWANLGVLLLAILWMTNLMNFMDGSDGLAATHGIMVLGAASFMLADMHGYSMTILSYGLIFLLAGFLTWNWPRATLFMGDSGSGFLGFLMAVFALASYKWFRLPLEIWIILTGPFWFDATVTLVRRMIAREPWTQPHCLHAYQRLIHAGWSHLGVLLGSMCLHSLCIVLAFLAFHQPEYRTMMVGISICLLSIIYLMIEIYKPMYSNWHTKQRAKDISQF